MVAFLINKPRWNITYLWNCIVDFSVRNRRNKTQLIVNLNLKQLKNLIIILTARKLFNSDFRVNFEPIVVCRYNNKNFTFYKKKQNKLCLI